MADKVRMIGYYYARVADQPGEGARVLDALAEAKVNLLAFHGFPEGGKAQLDFVPEDEEAFLEAASDAGIAHSVRKTVFLIQGKDRRGVGANLLERLADASINATAFDAVVSGDGRYGALLWVKPEDVEKTATVLRAKAR